MKKLLYNINVFSHIINGAFGHNKHLHNARFAKLNEIKEITANGFDNDTSLLIGKDQFGHVLRVRPTRQRRELGNFLVVAPTRGGKGLLATSQLLSWKGSVIVNDIKGDLFTQTAGYRSTLGDVYIIHPTGIGHRFDPLTGKTSEDELLSAAAHLLFKADEGDGAIFTQRATVMLTQLFLAAREEGYEPFPYVRPEYVPYKMEQRACNAHETDC